MPLPYTEVDVFTDTLLLGNPVAVVHAAGGLSSSDMAAFARWTNLSETTFLLPPEDPAADYRVRIFTPGTELPFAGHPTLGSARAWLEAGGTPKTPGQVVQECGVGLVAVRGSGERLAFAAPPPLRSGPVADADLRAIAAGLGLEVADVVAAAWCDNGPGWVGLLLADADTVLALEPGLAPGFDAVGVIGPYPAGSEVDFEVRAFTPLGSGDEDPVTGSLNASLAQWLIDSGRAPANYIASQGTRLQRRGRVHVSRDESGQVWVAGDTVVGVTGQVAL
jgi:PhzF family phenazine biosynthesis protein